VVRGSSSKKLENCTTDQKAPTFSPEIRQAPVSLSVSRHIDASIYSADSSGVSSSDLGYSRVIKECTNFVFLLMQIHREHYLRDDIVCGSLACSICPHGDSTVLSSEAPQYLLIDTNVALHQVKALHTCYLRYLHSKSQA
jgi:hypothetical protein